MSMSRVKFVFVDPKNKLLKSLKAINDMADLRSKLIRPTNCFIHALNGYIDLYFIYIV